MIAGTILGHLGGRHAGDEPGRGERRAQAQVATAPYLLFEIRPAGAGAPRIDPTPILDGWKLLATTDVYRSSSPMLGADCSATIGQILLMSKELLERRVLADKAVDIYDVRAPGHPRVDLPPQVTSRCRGVRERRGGEDLGPEAIGPSLIFNRSLAREGRLGFWRWLSMLLGIAGTYRKHDSIDVAFSSDGRRQVVGLAPTGPEHD